MAGQVYWLGADGNIYLKGADGVRNVGRPWPGNPNALQSMGFDSTTMSAEAQRINDPNPPAQVAPAGGTGGGTPTPDKSNDIRVQNAGLNSVDDQTSAGLAKVDKALGGIIGQYDTEKTANEANATQQGDTNRNNLQTNKESALVNAAQGRQGLMGTLASLGALSGSGIDLANRAVQNGANADLSGAGSNFAENQSGIDTSIGQFRSEDEKRRKDAETAAENAKTKVQNQAATNKQTFYQNLANDYAEMGDDANAGKYTDLAAALYPELAKTSVPDTPLAYSTAAFTPSTLASYMAGAGNTTVSAAPTAGGARNPGLPTLIASNVKKKQPALAIAT